MKKCVLVTLITVIALCNIGCGNRTTFNPNAYEITARVIANRVEGTEKVTYYNHTELPIREVRFNLYPNGYKDASSVPQDLQKTAYYAGSSVGGIEVSKGKVNGESVTVEDHGTWISFPLSSDLYPDESVEIVMDFVTTVPAINHRFGITAQAVNLTCWYPTLVYGQSVYEVCELGDCYVTESSDYVVNLTYPSEYVVASTGVVTSERHNGDTVTRSYCSEGVRDFALSMSSGYQSLSRAVGETVVKYYYLYDESPESTLSTACESMEFFNETYGKYAHSEFSLVETDLYYEGAESSCICFINKVMGDREYVIAHEVAHQWWYNAVGSDQYHEPFVDESLSEYSAWLYIKSKDPLRAKEIYDEVERSYLVFSGVSRSVRGDYVARADRSSNEYFSQYDYQNCVYNKGLLTFVNVGKIISEKKLIQGIRYYYGKKKQGVATLLDMIGCIETGSKVHVEELFLQWIKEQTVYLPLT